jgi:hypothetical protein
VSFFSVVRRNSLTKQFANQTIGVLVSATVFGGWSVCAAEELVSINEVAKSHGSGLDGLYFNGHFSQAIGEDWAGYGLTRFDSGKWLPIAFGEDDSMDSYGGQAVFSSEDSNWERKYAFYCCAGQKGKHGANDFEGTGL